MDEKILISAPLTLSDWMLRPSMKKFEKPSDDAVRYVLTRCKEFGMKRVYWRTFDAGMSTYRSKLADPYVFDNHEPFYQFSEGWIPAPGEDVIEQYRRCDFTEFDSLESAVRIGHELGLEIYGWISINEDDHGFGFPSRFTKEHPEFRWVRRNGYQYHSQLSFAFPEVREYKLGLVKELLEYDIDGLFLDWIRTGDIRDNPQTDAEGFADYGYEKPNVDAFRKMYGLDPHYVPNCDSRWIDVRSKPITEFMRSVRQVAGDKKILVMTYAPHSFRGTMPEDFTDQTEPWIREMEGCTFAGSKEGLLCDITTWSAENLVDAVIAAGYYTKEGSPERALNYVKEITGERTEKFVYGWIPDQVGKFEQYSALARKYEINEVLLWEADYIDIPEGEQRKVIAEDVKSYL